MAGKRRQWSMSPRYSFVVYFSRMAMRRMKGVEGMLEMVSGSAVI